VEIKWSLQSFIFSSPSFLNPELYAYSFFFYYCKCFKVDYVSPRMLLHCFSCTWFFSFPKIISCISTTSFVVLINGDPNFFSYPMRKGYPLSHFLLVIFIDFLAKAISVAKEEGTIKRAKITSTVQPSMQSKIYNDMMLMGKKMLEKRTSK
jgi:hypothetical protein